MIHLEILPQPDDVTCGPTSLHAVYNHWGHHIDLHTLIAQTPQLKDGGTLAVMLGIDALSRGFRTQLISYNLKILDPSWAGLDNLSIIQRLTTQMQVKPGKKFHEANRAYIKFLENGGEILWEDLTPQLLKHILIQGKPILTGLSATYLYNCKREYTGHNDRSVYDDIRGTPMGHFVVLCGLTTDGSVQIADPYKENPISQDNYYRVDIHRLINAILLGIVTYDANMLILEPRG
jgi:hypothetical protein